MSDRHLRELERRADGTEGQARLLRQRMRVGLVSLDVVRLRAWCMDEVSLLALGAEPCPHPCVPPTLCPGFADLDHKGSECPRLMSLEHWSAGLLRLAEPLPPWSGPCDGCGATPQEHRDGCRGVTVPMERYLAVSVAHAVGRERWKIGCGDGKCGLGCIDSHHEEEAALNAVARWLACPCPTHAEECNAFVPRDSAGMAYSSDGDAWWVRALLCVVHTPGHLEAVLARASEHLNPDRVREVACAAVLATVAPDR